MEAVVGEQNPGVIRWNAPMSELDCVDEVLQGRTYILDRSIHIEI